MNRSLTEIKGKYRAVLHHWLKEVYQELDPSTATFADLMLRTEKLTSTIVAILRVRLALRKVLDECGFDDVDHERRRSIRETLKEIKEDLYELQAMAQSWNEIIRTRRKMAGA